MHLIIDGEGARRFQLASKDRVLLLLHDLPHQMGMQIIKGPTFWSGTTRTIHMMAASAGQS